MYTVRENEKNVLQKIFDKSTQLFLFSFVKTLLSRNFCRRSVTVNLHTRFFREINEAFTVMRSYAFYE